MRKVDDITRALAVVILAIPMVAQVRAAGGAAPAPNGTASFSAAPMPVVYEFFIKEFVLLEDFADRLERRGESAQETRALLKDLTGLNEADFRMFAGVARRCVLRMTQADEELKGIAGKASGEKMDPATSARVSQLWQTRQNATMDAMTEVRRHVDAKTFAELEQRIRQHVVPKITRQASSEKEAFGATVVTAVGS